METAVGSTADRPILTDEDRRLLKDEEVAQALGVCRATVHNMTKRGMPSYKIGAARRWRLGEVLAWAAQEAGR